MSPRASAWAVQAAALVVLLTGLALVGVGVWWATDLPADPSELDGVAILFGMIAGAFGLVLAVVAAVALWLSRRRTYAAALIVGGLGMVIAAIGWTTGGLLTRTVSAPLLLGGLSIGAVGFGVALGRAAVTVDSTGGISR